MKDGVYEKCGCRVGGPGLWAIETVEELLREGDEEGARRIQCMDEMCDEAFEACRERAILKGAWMYAMTFDREYLEYLAKGLAHLLTLEIPPGERDVYVSVLSDIQTLLKKRT